MPDDSVSDLIAEIQRLRSALEAIVNTPRREGIFACQRIASTALRGGATVMQPKQASLGDLIYFARVFAHLLERWHSRCAYCGSQDALQIDHVAPVSRGGSDAINNLALACTPCNKRKGTQTADEFGYPDVTLKALGTVLPHK